MLDFEGLIVEGLLVAVGGTIGGLLRVGVSTLAAQLFGEHLPWGTFVVNVTGALAIGIFAGAAFGGTALWLLFVTGVLGSYTTVSTFSLQTLFLLDQRAFGRAALNAGGSLVVCLSAATLGFVLAGR